MTETPTAVIFIGLTRWYDHLREENGGSLSKPDKPNMRTFAYFLATRSLSSIGTLGIVLFYKSKAARPSSVGQEARLFC